MPENKKTFKVGNEVYDIEETQVKEFLKDVPDAIEVKSFTVDKDTFDIPLNDVNDFLKDVPDAKPLFTEIEPTGEGRRGARGAISGALGKPSAEPTKSGGLGSATKEKPQRVELQSQLPTNLSADQTQQLIESNIQGAELAGLDYESIAQQAAGKSPVQLGFEQLQKIQDPKEKFETARSLYKVAANQVTDDNSILESELTQFGQGIEQMKSELDFQRQQYEEFLAAGDSESANIIGEQINEQLEVFNQASGQYNQMVGKYNDNAKFLGILNAGRVAAYGEAERAGVTGSLKLPMGTAVFSNMIGNTSLPFSPDDVFVASTWNAIAPNVIRTLGAAAGLTGYFDSPAGLNLSTPSKDAEEALLNIANAIEIDAAKFSPQGTEFAVTEDVNAYSVAQLLGSLTGSIAGSIGSAGLAGTGKAAMVFNGTQGFGEMYSWGRENGLDELESTLLATPVALVYGYLGDKGVESLTNIVGKQSFKNIVKEGLKELGEQKTPQALSQLMLRSLKEFGKKTAEGTIREGIQEGVEFSTEFGTKKLAAETGLVDTKEDLSPKAFEKGLTESLVAGAIGGGLLGGLLGSSPRKTLADVVAKATKDPIAEQEFIDDMNSLLQGTQITREQYDEVMGEFEKAKAVNQTIPNNVTNDAARAEAIDLIQERDGLQQQAEVTDPAMVKPLTDRIDEINNNLNQISFFNQQTTQEEKVEKDWKKKAGLKSISEIIQGQKDKKDRAERLKSGKEIFDEQKKKGEQVRLRKEQEAKAQVEAQRLQRDAEVDELNRIRPDLTNEDLILGELSDNVDRVMDRMEMNIPTDIVSVDEAIAELDRKFDEISAYRNNPKRTHTTAQIDEVVELLDAAKTELQYYKETIIDDEKSIEERKRVSGIPETKTAQTTATTEVNQETITPQENEVKQEVQAEGQQEVISEPPQVEPLITEENERIEIQEQPLLEGLSGLRGEEETGQDRPEVRSQEEEQAKDEVISKATGTKVEDIKGLKQVLRDVFGLNNMQSDSVAVVMDRMIGAMAIREGVGKDEMYSRVLVANSNEAQQLQDASNIVLQALQDNTVATPINQLAKAFAPFLTQQETADMLSALGETEVNDAAIDKFAKGFEKYLSEGIAPDKSLEGIFKRFQKWLTDIYNGITGSEIDLALSDKMREIYSAMLGFEVTNTPTRQAGSFDAGEGKSILNSDTDLKGGEKDEFMLPVTYTQSKRVGDEVQFVNSQGEQMAGNYRGTNTEGKAIIDRPQNKEGKKYNLTSVVPESDVTFPKYEDTGLGKGSSDAIKYAIENDLYTNAISEGRMTATDAKKIIESAGLEVPKDIAEQSLKAAESPTVTMSDAFANLTALAGELKSAAEEISEGAKKDVTEETKETIKEAKNDGFEVPDKTEMQTKSDKLKDEFEESVKNLKQRFGEYFNQNLGISFDPRVEAQKQYNLHVAIVNAARAAIRLGVNDINQFAQSIGKKYVDRFTRRAWNDAVLLESGQPAIINNVDELMNEVYQDVANMYQEQREDAQKAEKSLLSKIIKGIQEGVFEKDYTARKMLKKIGAWKPLIEKTLLAGASSSAKATFDIYRKEIFGGLSKAEKSLLNDIIQARTIISIDQRFDAKGKKRPMHPKGTTMESQKVYLGVLEQSQKKLYDKLDKRADRYFEVNRELLKERLNEGRISIDQYNAMVNNEYSPRVFLKFLLEENLANGTKAATEGAGIDIKSIEEGDVNSLFHDAEWLLSTNVLATNKAIFNNRANRALYEVAKADPNNGLIQIQNPIGLNKQSGQPLYPDAPLGYSKMGYYENGVLKSMIVPNEFFNSWSFTEPLMNPSFANAVRFATGGVFLRMFATGVNPLFAITNFPRDISHAMFFTKTYSPVFPVALAQMSLDLIKTFPSAVKMNAKNKNGRYYKYLKEGGGMDFLSVQGKPFESPSLIRSGFEQGVDALSKTLGFFNERSEVWVRLAIRERAINRLTAKFAKDNGRLPSPSEQEQINREGTFEAREQMDFSKGGKYTKAVDNFIPYFSAAIQGLSVAGKYIKSNPSVFAFKMAQAAGVIIALMLHNKEYDDDYEDVPDDIKARYWIYMLPNTIDDRGIKKRAYVRIPKTQSAQPFITLIESMAEYALYEKLPSEKTVKSTGSVFPVPNPQDIPLVNALNTYESNYDRWTKRDVYKGAEYIPDTLEYFEGKTPYLWIDLAKSMNLSPERLKEALGKVVTDPDNNIYSVLAARAYDHLFDNIPENKKKEFSEMFNEEFKSFVKPFGSKFIGYSDPTSNKKTAEEIEQKARGVFKLQTDTVNMFVMDYFKGEKNIQQTKKDFNQWIKTQNKDSVNVSNLQKKFEYSVKFKDVDNVFWKMKSARTVQGKAELFYAEWLDSSKEKRKELEDRVISLGLAPRDKKKDFWVEFKRLSKNN